MNRVNLEEDEGGGDQHSRRLSMDFTSKKSTYATGTELWNALGSSLFFLDSLGGAVVLPVLPALVGEVGVESPAASTAWVGLLVGAYYAGRSGSIGAARLFSSASSTTMAPPVPSPPAVGVVLMLSAATYLACGLTVGRHTAAALWWLVAFRLLAGMLAAADRALAWGCLDLSGPAAAAASGTRSPQESVGAVGGLVLGCAVAGALFSAGHARPMLRLCIVATVAHVPAWVVVVLLWRKGGGFGGGCGAVADSTGYATVGGTPGGSDAEVELMRRPPWGARDNGDERRHATEAAPTGSQAGVSSEAGTGPASRGVGGELRIPGRYLRGCQGDEVEAERRWRLTLDWRAKERIDEVLTEPQPHFDVIKRYYPHYIHRRARNGCPVWIELPGRIDLPAIRSSGVSPEALQRHYVFVTEYLWGVVETDFENGQAVTVLDVQGLGMRDLAGEALGFVKQATAIVQDHYVERSNRMFIVNAPSYFSLIWRVVRPMLNERTQAKIGIINTDKKKIAEALLECIAAEDLPPQYGGTCPLELGQSEEEVQLRAYVCSITPSLAPRDDDDEDAEVEVYLHTTPVNANVPGSKGRAAGTVGAERSDVPDVQVHGQPVNECSHGSDDGNGPGTARRVVGTVTGALGWAGRKLAWRRSPVAHLGDENGFEYDADQQRWVLRKDVTDGRAEQTGGGDRKDISGGRGGGKGGDERRGGRGQLSLSRPERKRSVGSSTSEEMTVLAIQAAHHSLTEVGTKLSPVPSDVSPLPVITGAGVGRLSGKHTAPEDGSRLKHPIAGGDSLGANGAGHVADESCVVEHDLVARCPCLKPFGHRASLADFVGVLYATSTAVREALPVWLLAGSQAGGMGGATARIGVVIAAGVLLAEVGRAAASNGWLGSCLGEGSGGGLGRARRLRNVVRARLVMGLVLGLLYLLSKLLSPSAFSSIVVWIAVMAVVAANHASLELCINAPSCAGPSSSIICAVHDQESERRTSATSSASSGGGGARRPPRVMVAINASILAGDVLGSAAGPFLLALVLRTGWPSPFDTSSWLVYGLCADLWLSLGSREAEPRHTRLLDADDGGSTEEEHGVGGFAQFV